MAFESLTEKLRSVFKKLRGNDRLIEKDVVEIERKRKTGFFIESGGDLLGIPYGKSKYFSNVYSLIDLVFRLTSPYSDAELEELILTAVEKCFSMDPFNESDDSDKDSKIVLSKYYNVGSEVEATKKLSHLTLDFVEGEGYFLTAFINDQKGMFWSSPNSTDIFVPEHFTPGDLAKTFRQVASLCKFGGTGFHLEYYIKYK
jgi:hypothetical protein